MKKHGNFVKFLCIMLIIPVMYISCINDLIPAKRYPKNIDIPGYGKLVYTKTLFDGNHIIETIIDGDIIWSLDSFWGRVYRYDNNTKTRITIDIEKKDRDGYNGIYSINPHGFIYIDHMTINNDYLIIPFIAKSEERYSTVVSSYYIAKINRNNASVSIEKMPDQFDNSILHRIFFEDDKMYFQMLDSYFSDLDDVSSYVTSDFINYIELPDANEIFAKANISSIHMDSKGRLYETGYNFADRKPDTFLHVSLDDGNSWFTTDMGSNFPVRVTSFNDEVYVSCECYHEMFAIYLQTIKTGGGLHIFRWER